MLGRGFREVILGFRNFTGHKVSLKLTSPKSEDYAALKIEHNKLEMCMTKGKGILM
jgi:hypothetical protein